MTKNLLWKTIFIVAVMLVFLFGIIGMPSSFSRQGLLSSIQDRVHLGLDLRGGTHLILQVMVNDAVKADADNAIERLKTEMRTANVNYTEISQPDAQNNPDRDMIKGVAPETSAELRRIVQERLPEYDLASGAENSWTLAMKPSQLSDLKKRAVSQAIETIRNRIDQLGVSEPVIEEHGLGQYQILVQLPGVDDPARVKAIMQSTAMLEIRQAISGPFSSEQEARQQNGGGLPADTILMRGKNVAGASDSGADQWFLLSRSSAVTGRDLRDATATRDENNRPTVRFVLSSEGGKRFGAFTGAHVNDRLAVVLDNTVQEVAVNQEQIKDEGRITGQFTEQQANDLSMTLRSGALPAGIRYLEERTVGPSLGAASIRQGVRAAIIGMAIVMIFMLFYYHFAGINADLALILNLVILLGFLGFSGATLT